MPQNILKTDVKTFKWKVLYIKIRDIPKASSLDMLKAMGDANDTDPLRGAQGDVGEGRLKTESSVFGVELA